MCACDIKFWLQTISYGLAVPAFGLAIWHYWRLYKSDSLKFAIEIRKFFQEFKEINDAFKDGGKYRKKTNGEVKKITDEDWASIDAYMGTLEILFHARRWRQISQDVLVNQYKVRLENLLTHPEIRREINDSEENWTDLKALIAIFDLTEALKKS